MKAHKRTCSENTRFFASDHVGQDRVLRRSRRPPCHSDGFHLFCLASTLTLLSCAHHEPAADKEAISVKLATVENLKPAGRQRYSASILPNRQVNLVFRVSGFVDSIHQTSTSGGRVRNIDIGDIVAKGTTLAHVRAGDYNFQVSQAQGQLNQALDSGQTAKAQLAQAEAAATKANQDFERATALFQKKSLTKTDYDSAMANRDSTRAQVSAAHSQADATTGVVAAAQAGLGTAKISLQDTSIFAPFTGAIVERSVEIGTLAGPSVVAFSLADISLVRASFAVSDITVSRLKKGSRLAVYMEAFPSHQFSGFVSAIAAAADSSTRAFQVEVTVPNTNLMLRPGMIASLDAGAPSRSQVVNVAPLDSIVRSRSDGSPFALFVVEAGIARRKSVTLGNTYGDRIAIEGIETGKQVVSSGASFLRDGDAVRVIP